MAIPLIIIAGPTAIGKSDAAAELAIKINGEIISADSMQIYKLMDTGTSKPDTCTRSAVRHHLIDIIYPDEAYSVALYRQDAIRAIEKVHGRGKLPILVGGTGLYINSIINKVDFSVGPDHNFREFLEDVADKKGLSLLSDALYKIDPVTANKLEKNDKKRIIRALEVYYKTGRPISHYNNCSGSIANDRFDLFYFCIYIDRNRLYDKIERRVDIMIQNGLVEEVAKLMSLGYDESLNSMQAIGYKQMMSYLKGNIGLEESIQIIKRDTRHYAKRQLTWFKKDKRIQWIAVDDLCRDEIAKNIIDKLAGICK